MPDVLRTPDSCFHAISDWPYEPRYVEVDGLRIHVVDEGPTGEDPILLLHGEPSWAYLYRTMIAALVAGGQRCVAIDLVGFGRSDKPAEQTDYTYQRHVDWMQGAIDALGLDRVTLFCQDWGGLIGLRLVAAQPERFSRVCASNTFLPTGDRDPGPAFKAWREYSQTTPEFHIGGIIKGATARPVTDATIAAYDAPFPSDAYKAGARRFPMLVPASPDDPAAPANRAAWEVLQGYDRPFLTLFGDSDPVTNGADAVLQKLIPGCAGQPHATIANAAHFIQEDAGDELADHLLRWID